MNVAIAALSAPAQLNGVSRHAANLARALLCQRGISAVHFLAGEWQQGMFPELVDECDPRLHLHWISLRHGNLSRLAWFFAKLPQLSNDLKVDLVHLAYPAPVRAGAMPSPVVVTLHDLYPFDIPENFGYLRSMVSRRIVRQCLNNVSAVACVSASTRSQLTRWFGVEMANKAEVILNAVESKPAASRSPLFERGGGASFILCVAQHRQNKNVPLAIRIFANAVGKGILTPETQLLIIGIPGPASALVKKQIRQSRVEGQVRLLSGVSEAELQGCYRHCKFLLAPSSIEGFGLPIAEALLTGCPVVCSDIPAFREIGHDAVRYVPFGNQVLEGYNRAIREVLVEARPNALRLQHLSPQVIGSQYLDFYRKVINMSCAPEMKRQLNVRSLS